MVEASTEFSQDAEMVLKSAIMVYGNDVESFATVHNVDSDQNGAPVLLEGHVLTLETLNALSVELTKGAASKRAFNGYLPENVLAVGIGSIVWWLPAADRSISFTCGDNAIGNRSGITPHPSLVFGVNNGNWTVFAVKGNKRPTPETVLFQAPYFNVWSSGKICQGTVTVPNGATADMIDGWNRSFFESNFSHPNVHGKNQLLKYQSGAHCFWADALDGKFKTFPQRVLVKTTHSLDDYITATLNGVKLC